MTHCTWSGTCEADARLVVRRRLPLLAVLLVALAGWPSGCSDEGEQSSDKAAKELPPLRFGDDTSGLMLTWIDDRGDTHVTSATSKVPSAHRGYVRVVIEDATEGHRDPIYVADITSASGTYTARGVPRAEWEEEIRRRREKVGEIADAPPPRTREGPRPREAPPPNAPSPPGRDAPEAPQEGAAQATIYGASWCGACHQARKHLLAKGIKTAWKDIEKDAAAHAKMLALLEAHGRRAGSIPVIEVGSEVIVGFSAGALDRAIRKLKS